MDCVVFAIDGKERNAGTMHGGHDDFSGGYEDLFVGESYLLARDDSGVGCFESYHSHCGGNYELRFGNCGDALIPCRAEFDFGQRIYFSFAQTRKQFCGALRICHGNNFGMMASDLAGQLFKISSGSESDDLQTIRKRFNDIQTLATDGARRAENRNAFHAWCVDSPIEMRTV